MRETFACAKSYGINTIEGRWFNVLPKLRAKGFSLIAEIMI